MHRIKEIAIISLPVIAIALAVPLFTFISRNRAHQEHLIAQRQERLHPTKLQIESCKIKASTDWDAYHGHDATLWTRSVAPIPPPKPEKMWRNIIEISDIYGTPVATLGEDNGCGWSAPEGDAQVQQSQESLDQSEIFGDAKTVKARVSFEQTDDNCLTLQSISRDFVLQRIKSVPLASRRRSEFTIKKIGITPGVRGGAMEYRFTFTFAALDARFVQSPSLIADGWVVKPRDGSGFIQLQSFGYSGGGIEKDGTTTFGMTFSPTKSEGDFANYGVAQINAKLPRKPAQINVLLSADSGWPQQVHIELPQGLPPAGGKSANLPFRATLAPIPHQENSS